MANKTDKDLDEFKQRVQMWIQLDNEVLKLKEQMKEREKQKKMIEPFVLDFMGKKGHNAVSFGDNSIRYKVQKSQQSISKEFLLNTLAQYLKDEKKATDATNFIYNNRKTTEKTVLERKITDK
jgi:hypothetical protein